MKPKPFFSLNHFTVPRAMSCYLHRGCCLLGNSSWKKGFGENKKPCLPRGASPVTHASDCIPPDSVTISLLILCIHPLDTGPSVPNPYPPCQGRFGRPVYWRRGRDSNPRDAYASNGLDRKSKR